MKYLLVFFFAGFFLADAALIKKYKLSLTPNEEEFQGTVTLTLSDTDNTDVVQLDQYEYHVEKCTYTGIEVTPKPPTTSKTAKPQPIDPPASKPTELPTKELRCTVKDNKIQFLEGIRTGKDVTLQFKGNYDYNGLTKYTTDSKKRLYVADMTQTHNHIIFPCQENVKAEFEFADDVVMSNLENLRKKDENGKVFLRNLIFIRGDIVKDAESIPSFPFYHMDGSEKMGPKLKNVMGKVAELDADVQVLFTPVSEKIPISSRDLIILRDVLKTDDSKSDYSGIAKKLANKLFQKPSKKENAFLDLVGPVFVSMKILGIDTKDEESRQFLQIHGLEEDGFKNSKSLNELASEHGYIEWNTVLPTKGISVLYSLESICGDRKFMTGLSNYTKNDDFTGEEAFKDCFGGVDKAAQFFKVWVNDTGYPVVHVILNKTTEYQVKQEQFLWFNESGEKDQRWILPIAYKTKEGSENTVTLPATEDNVFLNTNSTYFILNHNFKGFYRVNYDSKVWEAIIKQLKSNHTEINALSRMQLIDDVFSFPKSVYKFNHNTPDYVTALGLSDYLRKETDFVTLQAALQAFDFLDSALTSSYRSKFRDHTKSIFTGIYNGITKKLPSNDYDKLVQTRVIIFACKLGVEECIKNATATFKEITLNTTELSVLQRIAICTVVRNDTAKWMDSFALLSAMEVDPFEKNDLLGCSRDKTTLSMFLTQFISQNDKDGFEQAVTFATYHNPDNIKVILDIINRLEGAITKLWGKKFLEKIVRFTLPKLNSESAATIKAIAKNLDKELQEEVDRICKNVELWTNTKAKSVGDYFKGSGSQAKPIALVLVMTTLVPLANNIFHN